MDGENPFWFVMGFRELEGPLPYVTHVDVPEVVRRKSRTFLRTSAGVFSCREGRAVSQITSYDK